MILPVILLILMGAIDFGRFMQARIVAEAAVRTGASWGAGIPANATLPLGPVYDDTGHCTSYIPTCNIEVRACDEAAGLPKYSGGPLLTKGGSSPFFWRDCAKNYPASTNSAANVCSPSGTQSNPFLIVKWFHPDGPDVDTDPDPFTPSSNAPVVLASVGDMIQVEGTFCFQKLFPWPAIPSPIIWTAASRFTIQP